MLDQLNAAYHSDIRFSCRTDPAIADFEVDIAFYDNPWYAQIASSVDSGTSWSPEDDPWADPAPARRDIRGLPLPTKITSDWATPFRGELTADDLASFTVDLNGPGMSGYRDWNSTSWGEVWNVVPCSAYPDEDDCPANFEPPEPLESRSEPRCGTIDVIGSSLASWYIWVREIP